MLLQSASARPFALVWLLSCFGLVTFRNFGISPRLFARPIDLRDIPTGPPTKPPLPRCSGDSCLALTTVVNASQETAFTNQKGCLAFIHIPKNAGGSFEEESRREAHRLFQREATDDKYRRWGIFDFHLNCSGNVDGGDPRKGGIRSCELPGIGACSIYHMPPSFDDELLASYKPCETFCVVRDPLEKIISEFKMRVKREKCTDENFHKWATTQLANFRKHPNHVDCHYMPQYPYVYDENNRRICDHIMNYTTLAEDFSKLMNSRGSNVRLNAHVHLMNNLTSCHVNASDSVKAEVAELYKLDYEAFGFQLPI